MRRLPWVLSGLLVVAAAVGTGLGLAGAPPGSVVVGTVTQQVLAATRAAGSASFTFSSVTRSSNPLLAAAATGSGVVDFHAGSVEVKVVDRLVRDPSGRAGVAGDAQPQQVRTEEVVIGRHHYLRLSALPRPATSESASPWLKFSSPTAPRGVRDSGGLGGLEQTLATQALGWFAPPFRSRDVVRLGDVTIMGTSTTEFSVDTTCRASDRPPGSIGRVMSTVIWVDSSSRLVEVRSTLHVVRTIQSVPGLPAAYAGISTTISTLRFEDFGKPVKILAPVVRQAGYPSIVVIRATAGC